jgi:hypothetical protein
MRICSHGFDTLDRGRKRTEPWNIRISRFFDFTGGALPLY